VPSYSQFGVTPLGPQQFGSLGAGGKKKKITLNYFLYFVSGLFWAGCQKIIHFSHWSGGAQPNRRGRGRGNRSRGKLNMRRDGTMKFEEDFDFETANAQFHKDEIDKELQTKLKLKASEVTAEEEEAVNNTCYYDKTKSFFDNLSCEDTRDRRPTWAEERRMNAETFGLPLRHGRGRGGFRGRGYMGPRGGRGRPTSRGSFGPPRGTKNPTNPIF
uniref:LSM14A mRNA processing body assembly factor b n=1 Tax=Oryzias latipes TaxID=8090 RepID=H2MGK1_ORYLA